MTSLFARILLTTVFMTSAASTPSDPLAGVTAPPIDIEVQRAPIGDVFMLLGDVIGDPIALDPCVGGVIDLILYRVEPRTLLLELAAALDLEYRRSDAGVLTVGCAGPADDAAIDVELRDVTAAQAVAAVSPGADVLGCDGQRVDLEVRNASRAAVLGALATELGATVAREGGAVVVRCG